MKNAIKMTTLGFCLGSCLLLIFTVAGQAAAVTLSPGDIVVANSGNVVAIDPQTGNVATVACCFSRAVGIAIDANGDIIVSDRNTASINRIDPATGNITTFSSGNLLIQPHGITIAGNGDILVADMETCCGSGTGRVVRVNPNTGEQTLVSSGGGFVDPIGINVEAIGSILVADFNARKLFRIDPATGNQTTLASFFPSGEPYDVAVAPDGGIFIVEHNGRAVIKVDPVTGGETTISSGALFDQPVGIAIEKAGSILVTDFTSNAVIRVDLGTGSQTIVASGAPALVNPWGIAVVAAPSVLTVAIDIKPGSFPNSINPRSQGRIPVAILTTDTFDATAVDPATVLFGRIGTEAAPAHAALEDVDLDGDTDMILHFDTQDTGIICGDTSASLTGETFGGQAIQGSDSINTVGCK